MGVPEFPHVKNQKKSKKSIVVEMYLKELNVKS